MPIIDLIRRHRQKCIGVSIAVGIPVVFLAFMFQFSKPAAQEDLLSVAAIALHDHYSINPPYGVWAFDGVRITDDNRLVVDVHVAVIPHATFIETRNKRIRYSYMKLACPSAKADVQKWLGDVPVWINLNFHGKTLLEGTCPKNPKGKFFAKS